MNHTFDTELFLGFLLDPSFQKEFSNLDPSLKSLFIQKNDDYLTEFSFKEKQFLGRFIGKSIDLSHFELSSTNIYSLLKKIVPNYPYDQSELWLIPVIEKE